jgi:hypothetical protein
LDIGLSYTWLFFTAAVGYVRVGIPAIDRTVAKASGYDEVRFPQRSINQLYAGVTFSYSYLRVPFEDVAQHDLSVGKGPRGYMLAPVLRREGPTQFERVNRWELSRDIPHLLWAMDSFAWENRCYAILALGRLSDERALAPLLAAFTGRRGLESDCAARALGYFGTKAKAAVPRLVETFPVATHEYYLSALPDPEEYDWSYVYIEMEVALQYKGVTMGVDSLWVGAQALHDITGMDFGKDKGRWSTWLASQGKSGDTLGGRK